MTWKPSPEKPYQWVQGLFCSVERADDSRRRLAAGTSQHAIGQ